MKAANKVVIGEWWTSTWQDEESESALAVKVIGQTPKGRLRVLKVNYFTSGCYSSSQVWHSTMKPKTLWTECKRNSLEFLIRYGGVHMYIKRCFDCLIGQCKEKRDECKRKVELCEKEIKQYEQR